MRLSLSFLAATLLSTTALAQQPLPAGQPQASQRADLCAELSAFILKEEGQKSAESNPTQQQAVAVQAPSKNEGERPVAGGSDKAQQSSGLTGPVTSSGPGAAGPQGQAQQSAPSGQPQQQAAATSSAPAQPQAPPPSPEAIQAAHAAIDGKDVLACRDAAQKMRRAGVNLPLPVLALAAVDPKILKPEKGAGPGGGAGP